MDYKKAGVDIEAGYKSVELMKGFVKETNRPEVLGGLGGFAGAFSMEKYKNMEEPVLVSGTDGCGTKVKLAFLMDKHDTIGIDAVAMCVNDIVCGGGEPLFFLDYIACGKNYPEKIATIVKGVGILHGGYPLSLRRQRRHLPVRVEICAHLSAGNGVHHALSGHECLYQFTGLCKNGDGDRPVGRSCQHRVGSVFHL